MTPQGPFCLAWYLPIISRILARLTFLMLHQAHTRSRIQPTVSLVEVPSRCGLHNAVVTCHVHKFPAQSTVHLAPRVIESQPQYRSLNIAVRVSRSQYRSVSIAVSVSQSQHRSLSIAASVLQSQYRHL